MSLTRRQLLLFLLIIVLFIVFVGRANASGTNTNDPSYWQDKGAHPAVCYKYGNESSAHGSVTNGGKAVTLNVFNPDWLGDHWEILVVDGGSNETVIHHPSPGTAYFPPLNNGGQQPNISHWIVCKGTETVVTTTTEAETTTTEAETTTTVDETTTTSEVITTSTVQDSTTVPGTTVPPTGFLPTTGSEQTHDVLWGMGAVATGLALMGISRRWAA